MGGNDNEEKLYEYGNLQGLEDSEETSWILVFKKLISSITCTINDHEQARLVLDILCLFICGKTKGYFSKVEW
ncbi:hypothetical protein EYC80_001871 [Monilinia laxa]|uniref:Uncharacterized protein n=1 Tax=Monilinia laxa TaxID=61186 RepID=A0A5N6K6F9_MONLA|nr:hypothetical protein EYC80_001871 [Monilinia laxa]